MSAGPQETRRPAQLTGTASSRSCPRVPTRPDVPRSSSAQQAPYGVCWAHGTRTRAAHRHSKRSLVSAPVPGDPVPRSSPAQQALSGVNAGLGIGTGGGLAQELLHVLAQHNVRPVRVCDYGSLELRIGHLPTCAPAFNVTQPPTCPDVAQRPALTSTPDSDVTQPHTNRPAPALTSHSPIPALMSDRGPHLL